MLITQFGGDRQEKDECQGIHYEVANENLYIICNVKLITST